MTKVAEVTNRALRLLRIVDPDEGAEPGQHEVAMAALNAMMRTYRWDRLALGWVAVDNPDDDLPAPAEAVNAMAYALAVELRPEFGATLDPDAMNKAMSEYFDLHALRLSSTYARMGYDLPDSEGCAR